MKTRKKLIEVALPLEAINRESLRRKQKAPKGWPTSFHKWWAQRPLAAARAVLFAQMIDDPSAVPELFPSLRAQKDERERLFQIIEDLILWDNTANSRVLESAQKEIWNSWRRSCSDNADLTDAKELFCPESLPRFLDPFAGSGSIPLSAQWLGLHSHARDLNPVAVVINKSLIEIPQIFNSRNPVNPDALSSKSMFERRWAGAEGLADDVRYYSNWMKDEAKRRIGHLYPDVEITAEIAEERPDLKAYLGQKLKVIAWIWARTVRSPNPAFAHVHVPLASTFMLSTKQGKEAYVEPVIASGGYRFTVKMGKPRDAEVTRLGTSAGKRAGFKCVMSQAPMPYTYIRDEGAAGRMGVRLMAIVVEGKNGRTYLSPQVSHEVAADQVVPEWKPETQLHGKCRVNVSNYGLDSYGDLFTPRQLVALTNFSDLVREVRAKIRRDAVAAGMKDDSVPLRDGGGQAAAYAEAVSVYLASVVDRMVYYGSTLTSWLPKDNALRDCMPRQALAMTWDFAEGNPFGKSSGDVISCSKSVYHCLQMLRSEVVGTADQGAAQQLTGAPAIVSTDPPYYDNIGYADLSDFFYVWMRRSLQDVFPDLFQTVAVPKAEELIATPYRHGSRERAEAFFLEGMTLAMKNVAALAHPAYPLTIYYAFKQSETDGKYGTASTGWETFLEAVIAAGLAISGTLPVRTEGEGRMVADGTNALGSSIVLVCRQRPTDLPTVTRREWLTALKTELPQAVAELQSMNLAPVDLAQAAIGPGMAVFTRYSKVIDAEGNPISVREALALINQTLDESLAEQEGDFDMDSRWALAWFEQYGFQEGEYGVAAVLANAKNTAVQGLEEAGILIQGRGKVRLLKPDELPADWDPATDTRLTSWEVVHHLIRVLETAGEAGAAKLMAALGAKAEAARDLCYRLYSLCERKKRANEALAYNGLVQSWPEISRLSREQDQIVETTQASLF